MNVIVIGIVAFVSASVFAVSAATFLIAWIARGSADVNGDPERDAGASTGPIDLHP